MEASRAVTVTGTASVTQYTTAQMNTAASRWAAVLRPSKGRARTSANRTGPSTNPTSCLRDPASGSTSSMTGGLGTSTLFIGTDDSLAPGVSPLVAFLQG